VTRTLVNGQPRFEVIDADADTVRETPILLLGGAAAAESLSYVFNALPSVVGTVYASFIERGGIGISNATVVAVTASTLTAPYLRLYRHASGVYAIEHKVGSTTVSAVAGSAPTINDRVELRAVLYSDGSVRIGQSINSGSESLSAQSSPLTKGAAWSGALLWVGSINGANQTQAGFRTVKIVAGERSLADMRRVYPT
jgi:hypothetical protein